MSILKLEVFGGMLPAVSDGLLPQSQAAYSRDAYLYSGELRGWREPTQLKVLDSPTTRRSFRIPGTLNRPGITAPSHWLEFADINTDVIRTPTIEDTFQRYYFMSPSLPPKYNTIARIIAAQSAWLLGVPAPSTAPSVAPSGGTGLQPAASRAYVYTNVTSYGEESAPSEAFVANGFIDDTWHVTIGVPDPDDLGVNRTIASRNIYRTVTGRDGTATFFLVTSVGVAVTLFHDTAPDSEIADNVTLPSATWEQPRSDLQGMVQAANGMLVAWRENEVWFSEPFQPHAWPSIYTRVTEYPIIGMGVVGQSIIVLTTGYPVVFTGTHPSEITSNVVQRHEPCTSKGSIVSAADAVYFTSTNGLIAVTPYGTANNITEKWVTREKWNELPLRSVRAAMSGPAYFAFGSVYLDPATSVETAADAQIGFTVQTPQTASQQVASPPGSDVTNPAFSWLTAPNDLDIYNVQVDPWSAVVLVQQDQKVWYYDFTDTEPDIMPYLWKSKVFQDNYKRNFSAMRIWFDVPAGTPAQNVDRTITPTIPTLNADMYGIVRVYAGDNNDGLQLLTTREIRTSGELLRINSGQKYEQWQFEFEGRVNITGFQVATSVKELRNG